MQRHGINTDDGRIELRTDYDTGGARLASQDNALYMSFDYVRVDSYNSVRVKADGEVIALLDLEGGEGERLINILEASSSDVTVVDDR